MTAELTVVIMKCSQMTPKNKLLIIYAYYNSIYANFFYHILTVGATEQIKKAKKDVN